MKIATEYFRENRDQFNQDGTETETENETEVFTDAIQSPDETSLPTRGAAAKHGRPPKTKQK